MVAATNGNFNLVNDPVYKQCIAAALRAADHVAPVKAWHETTNDMEWQRHQMTVIINNRILAIAAELEATTP
jgi:hypothetical protein